MISFPWEWSELSPEERFFRLFVWIKKKGLIPSQIAEWAAERLNKSNTIRIETEGFCACYNGSPGKCDSVYCSCVPLPNTTHSQRQEVEYFVAALATLIQSESLSPDSDVIKQSIIRAEGGERKFEWRVGSESLYTQHELK
ncbi:MAG: hypothetical protein ABIG08_01790 [bacterium]